MDYFLTEEQQAIIEIAQKVAEEKIKPVREHFDEVEKLDINGIHLLPYDIKMGESRIIHFFTYLADKAPLPIWIYHNPKRGRIITENIIVEIKQHPNIAGIKVGGYNLMEMTSAIIHRS